jgi:hypothetical protein
VVKETDGKKRSNSGGSVSLFKNGSKANWNLAHKRYVKSLIGVKDFVRQQ